MIRARILCLDHPSRSPESAGASMRSEKLFAVRARCGDAVADLRQQQCEAPNERLGTIIVFQAMKSKEAVFRRLSVVS
jgi:hypothetical protein